MRAWQALYCPGMSSDVLANETRDRKQGDRSGKGAENWNRRIDRTTKKRTGQGLGQGQNKTAQDRDRNRDSTGQGGTRQNKTEGTGHRDTDKNNQEMEMKVSSQTVLDGSGGQPLQFTIFK